MGGLRNRAGAVAHGISAVAGMHAEQALNLFSALCASLAVWLLYSINQSIITNPQSAAPS